MMRQLLQRVCHRSFHLVANHRVRPCIKVDLVPMFQDNYAYLVRDEINQTMVAIDPGDGTTMLTAIEKEEQLHAMELVGILSTHKHWDHVNGNETIAAKYPDIVIAGPATEVIPAQTMAVHGGDSFHLDAIPVKVLSTPCHTGTSANEGGSLFCGDTLFVAGCGRFFEGTAKDMYHSLYDEILGLPRDTMIYCGHEYTLSNLAFARHVDPGNEKVSEKLVWATTQQQQGRPTIPSTLEAELGYNPFLRVHERAIQQATGATDPVEVLARLRKMKDSF